MQGHSSAFSICSAPGCKCHWGKGDWLEVVNSFSNDQHAGSGLHQPAMGRECRCCCCRAPAEEIDLLDSDDESGGRGMNGTSHGGMVVGIGGVPLAKPDTPCVPVRPFHPVTFSIARTLVLMKGRRGSFFNRLFDYLSLEQAMGIMFTILDYADGFSLPTAGQMLEHFEHVHFGLPDPGATSGHIWAKQTVSRFMNRLLGLPLPQQQSVFTYFQWLFTQAEAQQRDDGTLDVGVTSLAGESELVSDQAIEVGVGLLCAVVCLRLPCAFLFMRKGILLMLPIQSPRLFPISTSPSFFRYPSPRPRPTQSGSRISTRSGRPIRSSSCTRSCGSTRLMSSWFP